MKAILQIAGTTLGGWIGWWLGARFGVFVAFLLSLVGTAFALYWTRRLTRDYFG